MAGRAAVIPEPRSTATPAPPTRLPRSPPPTCQGKELRARAAKKRRSKLRSRGAASALSSGAMAGRGRASALPERSGERGCAGRRPEATRGAGVGLGAGPGAAWVLGGGA